MTTSNALVLKHNSVPALKRNTHCANCGAPLEGNYCHECGQRDIDFKQDSGELVKEVYSSVFDFDSKLSKGIVGLLFKPGDITLRYLEGKRASQIPPFRFYLVVCLIFLFTISLQNQDGLENHQFSETVSMISEATGHSVFTVTNWIQQRIPEIQLLQNHFIYWFPRAMMLGIPFLAFVSWFSFANDKFNYIEHLVITIHIQTFIMLWFLLMSGWALLFGFIHPTASSLFFSTGMLWTGIYPIVTIHRIFRRKWYRSIVSGLFLEFAWMIYFAFFLLVSIGLPLISNS